ncbi:MAG: alpha/beta hydrolase, partial [Gemmatimonadota bacterium]
AAASPAPAEVEVQPVETARFRGEWVWMPGADPDRRILYLHGGGYTAGSSRTHRRLAADLSAASGCVSLVLDYPLAPEHPFPAATDAALAAYRWIRRNNRSGEAASHATFVAGDSAGGNLTLETIINARDDALPLPQAAVTFSAWTDLAATGETVKTRAKRDPILSDPRALIAAATVYAGQASLRHPGVSPLYAELRDLPPLFMNVGDDEVLLDDTLRFAARAAAAGVEVRLSVEPAGFHTYPYFVPDAPESVQAVWHAGEFLRSHG